MQLMKSILFDYGKLIRKIIELNSNVLKINGSHEEKLQALSKYALSENQQYSLNLVRQN